MEKANSDVKCAVSILSVSVSSIERFDLFSNLTDFSRYMPHVKLYHITASDIMLILHAHLTSQNRRLDQDHD